MWVVIFSSKLRGRETGGEGDCYPKFIAMAMIRWICTVGVSLISPAELMRKTSTGSHELATELTLLDHKKNNVSSPVDLRHLPPEHLHLAQ